MASNNKSSRRLWWIIGGIAVALIALVGILKATGALSPRDQVFTVETARAEVRDITQIVTASGKVQPETEVKISPDVSGEIIELKVKEGDKVNQGDLLARIKPDYYTAQVEQAQAGVLQSRAALAERRADMMKAEIDLKRQQSLFEKNVISEADFQTTRTQYDVSIASYEAARFAVQSAEARFRESREQLAKTSIYAPMTGTISQLNVEYGERVVGTSQMAGTEMMTIARLEQMELEVDVNENDVVNVSIGDTASIEVDAYPERKFKGVVTEIANSARISNSGSQEQVTNFPVKVRVLDAHNIDMSQGEVNVVRDEEVRLPATEAAVLRPGMTGTVDIYTETVTRAIAIPIQAVTVRDLSNRKAGLQAEAGPEEAEPGTQQPEENEDAKKRQREKLSKVVFVVAGDSTRMVPVETGISNDTHIVVRSGLKGNESIIIGPFTAVSRELVDGSKIKLEDPKKKGAPAAAKS